MDDETETIKRIGEQTFGAPIPDDALELVRSIYRKILEDLEQERAA